MNRQRIVLIVTVAFLAGLGASAFAKKKTSRVTPELWRGKENAAAAASILEVSRVLAEDGSWENIHVGRVLYLSGDTERAEEIFSRYQEEASDLIRIGRVYVQADRWDMARPLFDRVVEMKPKDEDWLAEIGAYYNLNGERERAEALFARSFDQAPESLKNALTAAGSYLGVAPRRR